MPYKIMKKGAKHCVVKESGGQIACHDTRAGALKQMKALYANEKADLAHSEFCVPCCEPECERAFLTFGQMIDHAEAVHTFSDIERMLREAVREKYGRPGDYHASPPVPAVWAWVEDVADDWVVFTVEESTETTLYKASYSILDNSVTLGDPVEVRRRTVYEPVKKD